MAITSNDLIWRKSSVVSATASQNGGVVSFLAGITSNIKNNVFPDVSLVERTAGSVTNRKVFLHVNKNSQDELLNATVSLGTQTSAEDFVVFYSGTKAGVESALVTTRPYGVGVLASSVLAGATTLSVTPENLAWYTANTPIRAGDLLIISDDTNTDYVTASAAVYGADLEITCSATTHAFASNVVVASVYSVSSTKANYTAPGVTSTAGVFTSNENIVVNAKGCTDEVWTLTFTNATSFTVSGATLGTLGVGTTTSDTAPNNAVTNTPYFVVKSAGFSGTFVAGDTLVFSTSSATIPLWLSRVVPAGTTDTVNDTFNLRVNGESY